MSNSDQSRRTSSNSMSNPGSQPRRQPVGSAPAATAKPATTGKISPSAVPTRTSSAPPEGHGTEKATHFQPTKTGPGLHAPPATGEFNYKSAALKASSGAADNGKAKSEESATSSPATPAVTAAPFVPSSEPKGEAAVAEFIPSAPVLQTPVEENVHATSGNYGDNSSKDNIESGVDSQQAHRGYDNRINKTGNARRTNNNRGGQPLDHQFNNAGYAKPTRGAAGTMMPGVPYGNYAVMPQQMYYANGYYYDANAAAAAGYYGYQQAYYYPFANAMPATYPNYMHTVPATGATPAPANPPQAPSIPAKAEASPVQFVPPVAPTPAEPVAAAPVAPSASQTPSAPPVQPAQPAEVPATSTTAPESQKSIPVTPVVKKTALRIKPKGSTAEVPFEQWKNQMKKEESVEGSKEESVEPAKPEVPVQPASIPEIPVSVPRTRKNTEEEVKVASTPSTPLPPVVPEASPIVTPRKDVPPPAAEEVTVSAAAPRRLVPGGQVKLNQGPIVRKYTKSELLSYRPAVLEFNPATSLMGPIASDGGGGGHGKQSGGGWKGGKGEREPRESGRGVNTVVENVGGDGWGKEQLPTPTGRRGKNAPAGPMPKKVVSDPLEKLTMDVTAILNKITPQTFEKLSQQILEIKLEDTSMLDRVVQLIFEKAVQEPNFTFMYADLCLMLKEKGTNWVFYTVVKSMDSEPEEYFWIRDFTFPNEAATYYCKADCMAAIQRDDEALQMKPLSNTLQPESIEYILYKNKLYRIGHEVLCDKVWYLTAVSFDKVSEDKRGQTMFADPEIAKKEAIGEVSFRGRLAHSCEQEFTASVKNENIERLAGELRKLHAERQTMSEEEFLQKTEEIEEQRGRLKRRMLGNIRFVGELYKKKLLNTDTMHDCIVELLGSPGEWKPSYEEADLELLCRFLKTVGESLESKSTRNKSKPELGIKFNQYFDRMHQLTKDKNVNSRIRFNIEEVIALRENGWQARREQEGPKKLAEIHQQVQAEQTAPPKMARQPSSGSLSGQGGRGGGNRRDSDDARNPARDAGRGGRRDRDDRDNRNNNRSGGDRDRRGGVSPMTPSSRSQQQQPRSSAVSAPVTTPKEPITFQDNSKRNLVRSSLEEYLSGVEIGELIAMLKDDSKRASTPSLLAYLLLEIISKYVNLNNAAQQNSLLRLFDNADFMKFFQDYKYAVDAALENCEPFKTLPGTAVDVIDAPQRIARILSHLIKGGATTLAKVQELTNVFKQQSLDEDLDDPEMIEACFQKFLKALEA
eukprot:gene10250-11345_t